MGGIPALPPRAVLIDFASMDYGTQSKLIGAYRGMFPMYSDAGGCRCCPAIWGWFETEGCVHVLPSTATACQPAQPAHFPLWSSEVGSWA